MEPNEQSDLPPDGMNPDYSAPPEEKQPPRELATGHTVNNVSGAEVLIDGVGTLANGTGILGDGVELVGGVANAAGEAISGAGELISGGAEAAGSVLEGVGGCIEGCGSCSLVMLVAFFLMAGTALAVFR